MWFIQVAMGWQPVAIAEIVVGHSITIVLVNTSYLVLLKMVLHQGEIVEEETPRLLTLLSTVILTESLKEIQEEVTGIIEVILVGVVMMIPPVGLAETVVEIIKDLRNTKECVFQS